MHNPFTLYLIRHGQSEGNLNHNAISQLPTTNLTELGIKQVKALKDKLAKENITIDHLYSSDYNRAFQTAKILSDGKYINQHEALREYSAGDWTGKDRTDTLQLPITLHMSIMNSAFLPPNGESMHMVERRVGKWLEDTILYNSTENNPNHVVVSHGMTIKCFLKHIMNFDSAFVWRIDIENASLTKLTFGKLGWKLHYLNDYNHIKELV